jgi:hypothetical protein
MARKENLFLPIFVVNFLVNSSGFLAATKVHELAGYPLLTRVH